MTVHVEVQDASGEPFVPEEDAIRFWISKGLQTQGIEWLRGPVLATSVLKDRGVQLTVRLVGKEESAILNERYRHRKGPTNVLSFPYDQQTLLDPPLLGDMVICAPLVTSEAQAQNKELIAHWAHLVIHGFLHLMGYDHETDSDADMMEDMERCILQQLDLPDPYHCQNSQAGHS